MTAILKIGDTEWRPARISNKIVRAWLDGEFGEPLENIELVDGVLIDTAPALKPESFKLMMDDVELRPGRINATLLRAMWQSEYAADLERLEMFEGVLIEMSPARRRHGSAHSRLAAALVPRMPSGLDALSGAMVYLGEDTMLAPDIAILPLGMEVEDAGPGDFRLAIEISDTTLTRDLVQKARLYGTHVVPEYWVVDLDNRRLHIHRNPGPDGYASVTVRGWDEPASPLFAPDLTLDLSAILKDIG